MKILGVHPASHDTSACLVEDGQVTYAAAEERISRTCHDGRFPEKVIGNALEYAGLQAGQIDAAAISWSPPLKSAMYTLIDAVRDATGPMSAARFGKSAFSRVWSQGGARALERIFGIKKIYFCDHHLAHAISAFSYSGFKEAAVVVIDGRGAFEASSIWLGRDGQLTPIEIIRWPNSLGLFYAKFTTYLGFKALSDEWKVMGLAAFGQPGVDLSSFISHDEEPYKVHTTRLSATSLVDVSDIERVMGPKRQDHQPIEQRHKDIAYAVQKHCERAMLDTVHYAIRKTGLHSVCLAGGVAMNCKANGLVANDPEVERIFVQPASADDGTALGAALYPYLMTEGRLPTVPMQHPYFGDQYTAEEIEASLQKYKLGYERMNNRAETIAQLLADGNIIGHFNNRMEFGARALGNRSIIADPRTKEMQDKVNNSVKYRETWRPFAPSVLDTDYFEMFETNASSPFMILSFPVKAEHATRIPAAVHVDNTARPQTVTKEANPDYWDLISKFKEKTGVPAVVNTSFNLKGEPIVRSPFDAIRTFHTSGLDALVLNDFLILKSGK